MIDSHLSGVPESRHLAFDALWNTVRHQALPGEKFIGSIPIGRVSTQPHQTKRVGRVTEVEDEYKGTRKFRPVFVLSADYEGEKVIVSELPPPLPGELFFGWVREDELCDLDPLPGLRISETKINRAEQQLVAVFATDPDKNPGANKSLKPQICHKAITPRVRRPRPIAILPAVPAPPTVTPASASSTPAEDLALIPTIINWEKVIMVTFTCSCVGTFFSDPVNNELENEVLLQVGIEYKGEIVTIGEEKFVQVKFENGAIANKALSAFRQMAQVYKVTSHQEVNT